MSHKSDILLVFVLFLAGCASPSAIIQTQEPSSQSPIATLTSISSVATNANATATTSHPTDTAVSSSPTFIDTITPNPTSPYADLPSQSYCDLLAQEYQPPEGSKTYCDVDYGFAFDYPMAWRITYVTGSPDTPDTSTVLVRKAQRFEANGMSNYIRVDTYHMPNGSSLAHQVEQFWSYPSREITDQPYDVQIGGQRAYAIINRYHQDYSAVYLFFQHGVYYSVMEVKAISQTGLDMNWQIARSIQVPGSSPQDNHIPADLIEDSYKLTLVK